MTKLLYGGPRHFLVAGEVTGLLGILGTMFYLPLGLCVTIVGTLMFVMQSRIEATYWKSRCELQLDAGLERALRAELPRLMGERGTRTEKLSDIIQKVVDESKD